MSNRKYDLKALAALKYATFKIGRKKDPVEVLRELIAPTDLPSGDIAEIVLAYMLGYLTKTVRGLYVDMSAYADMKGVDFVLTRFGYEHKLQLKFNRKDRRDYGEDIVVFYAGPSRKFVGAKYLDEDRGDDILLNILLQLDVYDFDEACDIIDGHCGLKDACIEAWEIIRN